MTSPTQNILKKKNMSTIPSRSIICDQTRVISACQDLRLEKTGPSFIKLRKQKGCWRHLAVVRQADHKRNYLTGSDVKLWIQNIS